MSEIEYSDLLFEISTKIGVNQLERLVFMCRNQISKGSARTIQNALGLFEELEKRNNLGIDRLETLKQILTQLKNRSMLKKVEEFEIKRKAQSVGIIASLKQAAVNVKGAIKMVCNFRTIGGGLLVVGSGMALRSCSTLDEYVEAFTKIVLVAYTKLIEISEGSLCFTVQAETPAALKELWDIYKDGTLQSRLQEFLVTDDIKHLANGENVEITVFINKQEYKEAYLDLLQKNQDVPDIKEEERLWRNSDSFLCSKLNEDEVTLMKLKQMENKLSFERKFHEEEIMKLKEKIVLTERLSGENDRTVNLLAPNLLCIHVALRLDLS
ncbi:uncharacterized protein LOC111342102 [Stylophora pistillata]|uniref:uncharacterized protein LOC111342102 n=1 Tax=Stylophora pistillata TaxID=50429 RepID=UPI000C04AAA9|nr:uncharacterized protein LOC111342102 [Stylophora pistillata]